MSRKLFWIGVIGVATWTVHSSTIADDLLGLDDSRAAEQTTVSFETDLATFESAVESTYDRDDGGLGPCEACCDPGWIGQVDWLNWKARRQGLDFATFLNPVWLTPASMESLSYDRDDGIRIGLGYQFESCWDITWTYTYFHTDDAGSADTADQPGLVLNSNRSFMDTAFQTVWAQASLDYDVNDLEAGRAFSVAHNATMRVFGGFRWAIIDQDLRIGHTYRNAQQQTITGNIQNPTNMDGYGIRVGTEGRWTTTRGLSLFAQGAGSVLVGRFDTLQQEIDQAQGTIINFSDTYTQAVPVLDVAAGVAWRKGPLEISGGYELNSWFNMAEVGRGSYDLILDGFFMRLAVVR